MQFPIFLHLKPTFIFLIDALGAGLTTVMLIFVVPVLDPTWVNLNRFYEILPILSGIFTLNSFIAFLFLKKKWRIYLQIIAIANIFYCLYSSFTLMFYMNHPSALVITYFSLEILIILFLVYLELNLISVHKKNRTDD